MLEANPGIFTHTRSIWIRKSYARRDRAHRDPTLVTKFNGILIDAITRFGLYSPGIQQSENPLQYQYQILVRH